MERAFVPSSCAIASAKASAADSLRLYVLCGCYAEMAPLWKLLLL